MLDATNRVPGFSATNPLLQPAGGAKGDLRDEPIHCQRYRFCFALYLATSSQDFRVVM